MAQAAGAVQISVKGSGWADGKAFSHDERKRRRGWPLDAKYLICETMQKLKQLEGGSSLDDTAERLMETLDKFYRHRLPRSIANIPRAAFVMLCAIDEHTQGGETEMPVSQLSEVRGISRAGVSQLLRSLEKRGYIVRTIDPDDRRVVLVKPTVSGREVVHNTRHMLLAALEKSAAAFGEEKTNQLCDLLLEFCEIRREIEQNWQDSELMEWEGRCVNSSGI